MPKIKTIYILSIIIVLLPFLGLPQSVDNFFYVIFGLTILTLAYLIKRENNPPQKETNDGEYPQADSA
jgi:hypothetical protein